MNLKGRHTLLLSILLIGVGLFRTSAFGACSEETLLAASLRGLPVGENALIPQLRDLPVPESRKNALLADPAIQTLRTKWPDGKGLWFEFENLDTDGSLLFSALGEGKMSWSLKSELQVIFPAAAFSYPLGEPKNKKNLTKVRVEFKDRAEAYEEFDMDPLNVNPKHPTLSMAMAKSASFPAKALDGRAIRRAFGVGQKTSMQSYYLVNASHVDRFFEQALNSGTPRPDVLFVSTGASGNLNTIINMGYLTRPSSKERRGYVGFKRLSEIKKGSLPQLIEKGKTLVVLNDVPGAKSALDAMCAVGPDGVAVISGPINGLESIAVGLPTLWIAEPFGGTPYSRETLEKLMLIARKTGGARTIDKIEDFPSALREVFALPREGISSPEQVGSPSSEQVWMSHLNAWLRASGV